MKILRIASFMLAAAILVSSITGCKPKESAVQEDISAEPVMTENTLPITEEEITLDVWIENGSQGYMKSYNDMKIFDEIRKRTGIKLNFIHPTGTANEQLNIILASNDYPDIIFSNWSKTGQKQLDDGVAVRLNDYIDKFAPNLKKLFEKNPEYRKQLELANGDIMMFPKLVDDEKFLCYDGYFIRKDWLDKVGMGIPTNIGEWHDVLKAFKETDLNGNGKNDEIPFSAVDWAFEDAFLTAFDIPKYDYFKLPGEDKIIHAVLAPRFREYLQTMKTWYEEGLINQNFLNTTSKEMDALALNNQLGAFYGDNNNSMPKYMALNEQMELAAVPYPKDESGNQYYPRNDIKRIVRGDGGMITSSCKHVKEAVRLCDYLYSEEGQALLNWGFEGESYTVSEDGTKQYTDLIMHNPDGKTPYEAICQYMTNTGFMGIQEYAAARGLEANLSPRIKKVKTDSVEYAMQTDKSLMPIPPKFTTEESQSILQKESDIDSYINEMIGKFILGVEPLENFDQFIADIKTMGIDDVIAVYQQAYERQGFE